jgi:hypothetical protein
VEGGKKRLWPNDMDATRWQDATCGRGLSWVDLC